VRVLLPGVGVGAVHVGSHRVGHDLAVGVVLSPLRDRIGQVLADHALKGLAVARPVQPAKEIVQRPVLEHHDHYVIEGIVPTLIRHALNVGTSRRR
jgi:hypothetical protein